MATQNKVQMENPVKVYNSLKEFKEDFDNNFKIFKNNFEDATFDDFVEEYENLYYDRIEQLEFYELSGEEWRMKMESAEISGEDLNEINNKPIAKEFQDKKGDIDNMKFNKTKYTTAAIYNFILGNKNTTIKEEITKDPNIAFDINQTQLMELIKSLVENKNVVGKQKDIINLFAKFFNKEIKNPDKLIQDIKNRNNGSETLFLTKLQSSLLDFIKKENTR